MVDDKKIPLYQLFLDSGSWRESRREREREKKMADLSHHHADKLVEVHGPASVLVDLLYDVVEVVLCKCTVNLTEDFFKNLNLRKNIIYMFFNF